MQRVCFFNDLNRSLDRNESKQLDVLDWLSIWEDSQVYFDGNRDFGYGGYHYDGRWKKTVGDLKKHYNLDKNSTLLDVGCAKGFLVHDYNEDDGLGCGVGVDISMYALIVGKRVGMSGSFFCANATKLPFEDKSFDLVFCKDTLHNILTEEELIIALKEIQRVSINSWIRVGAYNSIEQKQTIDNWATFTSSYFSTQKWHSLFNEAGYTGDYDWFHPNEVIYDQK